MGCECNTDGLIPLEQAKQTIWQLVRQVTEKEACPLDHALDRILAEDIVSPIDVPAYDNSAMDGYALRHQDLAVTNRFKLIGKSFAGQAFKGEVDEGECVRIMTGAQTPTGADTVVIQENTQVDGHHIDVIKPPRAANAIRLRGEDINKGSRVFRAGRSLSAPDIGLLASLGVAEVSVTRKLKVAVLSTGDELQYQGNELAEGQIFDSNRPALKAMLSRLAVDVLDLGIIRDDKDAIQKAFEKADAFADLVISSGGVSVGEADYTKAVLQEMGDVGFWKLAIKPGKPLAFGRLPNSLFFGLPGNPVSAMVTFHKVALPTIQLMMGQTPSKSLFFTAKAATEFRKKAGRTEFQRATCWRDPDGNLMVESSGSQGSGILSSMSYSNCYVLLDSDCHGVEAGQSVNIELFDSVLAH